MDSPTAPIHLTLSDIERLNSRSHIIQSVVSRKRAKLGHMLLINHKKKPYMGSPMTPWHLTLSDLERSKSRSLRFKGLYVVKESS